MKKFSLLLLLLACTGCYQGGDECGLRTVPVTNNPNVRPNQGAQSGGIGL